MAKFEKMFDAMGLVGMSLIGLGAIGTRFIFVVDGGERAVVFNRLYGVQEKIHGEGMHFKIPFLYVPRFFEIRTRPREIKSITGTRDLQQVELKLRLLFRP